MWVSGSDKLLDDRLVDLGVLADRLEPDLLAGLLRQLAHQPRHAANTDFTGWARIAITESCSPRVVCASTSRPRTSSW